MHIRSFVWAAFFAALTAVGGFIKIPVPYVPFTLQIAAVYLAGCLLGPRTGALSQLLYVLIGLAGAPLLSAVSRKELENLAEQWIEQGKAKQWLEVLSVGV